MVNPLTWTDPYANCSFTIEYGNDAKTIQSVQIVEQDGTQTTKAGNEIQYLPNDHYANSDTFDGTQTFFICLTTTGKLYLSPPEPNYFNFHGLSENMMRIKGVYDPTLSHNINRANDIQNTRRLGR